LIGVIHGQTERSCYSVAGDAWVAEFEPGDGTHYEFMWCVGAPSEYLRVAGLPDLKMYEYLIDDILQCYETHKKFVGTHGLPEDGFLGYVCGHSGHCNPWTAWAMVQCIAEHLLWMNANEEGRLGK